MTHKLEHAERWKWFLDIVFGAIVALAIQKYEPVVRVAWSQGLVSFSFSLFVSICVCSFVVYDISAYHILVKEFAYSRGKLGFMRFYLDLIMAFILYVFLVGAFQIDPDWYSILLIITGWHVAAAIWHVLALKEHNRINEVGGPIVSHLSFVVAYWVIVFIWNVIGGRIFSLGNEYLSRGALVVVSATILIVSVIRWNQILKK